MHSSRFSSLWERMGDFFNLSFTRKIIDLPFVDFFLLSDDPSEIVPFLPANLADLSETECLELLKELCCSVTSTDCSLDEQHADWISMAKSLYLDPIIEIDYNNDENVELTPFLLKMNAKKRHEVPRLAKKIKESNVKKVVDIGCGQCYLSSYLVVDSDCSVLAYDGDPVQIKGAQKRIQLLNRINCRNVKALQSMSNNLKMECEFVDETFLREKFKGYQENWCMTSLHACGDLSVNMINAFINIPSCSYLVNLSCCYHKLSSKGFPLSKRSRKEPDITSIFGPRALNMASEVPHRWRDPLYDLKGSLKRNYYRALLQVLLVEIGYMEKGQYLRLGSNSIFSTFSDFAHDAVAKLGIKVTESDIMKVEKRLETQKHRFYYCMALKSILGPVIESFVLLDRYFYLEENGFHPKIVTIFDKLISPRNKALIICK